MRSRPVCERVDVVPEDEGTRRESDGEVTPRRPRPFWSGTIAFGLVSLPVDLYAANRASRVSLRLVDADGTPLTRRYVSTGGGEPLESEEIVRGRSIGDDRFVVVEDDELEALAPEQSQEIDLTQFVDVTEIDPTYFGRSYFLAPARGAQRAYRLLAQTMEDAGKAGIATFVMRGKAYLVAILAEQGILRAETLRFFAEVRSPEAVGLPALDEPDPERLLSIERAIEALAAESLDRSLLRDLASRRLLELVETKREGGDDVVALSEPLAEAVRESVDVMALLKRSLAEEADEPEAGSDGRAKDSQRAPSGRALEKRSKAELYERAQELDVPGRSRMTKQQLAEAIRDAR